MKTLRTANQEDFKTGTILITSEGFEFRLTNQYDKGIWETNKSKVIFETEAKFYKVKG